MQFFFLLRCCFYVFQLLLVVSIARPEEGYQLRWCSLSLIHFYCLLLLSRLIFIFYCKRSFEAFLFLTHSRSPACFALSQTARLLLSQIDYAAILYFFRHNQGCGGSCASRFARRTRPIQGCVWGGVREMDFR